MKKTCYTSQALTEECRVHREASLYHPESKIRNIHCRLKYEKMQVQIWAYLSNNFCLSDLKKKNIFFRLKKKSPQNADPEAYKN